MIVPFPGPERTSRATAGGKGQSLIRMTAAGVPVPPGAILTTVFFSPWFDTITRTEAWTALTETPPNNWIPLCDDLRAQCRMAASTISRRASPDHFVVNTVDRTVVEAIIGTKGVSVRLDPEGGTVEQEEPRAGERTLGTTHLQELTNVLARIEALFEHPVDVEWAYADDQLHVLVAVTTDPGWTPLFANAAAVVLEVGGTLQHGAVVAREYGKPCVVGLDRATTLLDDGQQVEVDGARGTVRLLDAP